jgi:hypothetical protein
MLLERDAAYLAGLREGSFTSEAGYKYPIISLAMTDFDVMINASTIMQTKGPLGTISLPSGKTLYRLTLTGTQAAYIMEEILPYMGSRRTIKIREILEAYYNRTGTKTRKCLKSA